MYIDPPPNDFVYFFPDYKEVIGRLIKPLLPNILFSRTNVHKVVFPSEPT